VGQRCRSGGDIHTYECAPFSQSFLLSPPFRVKSSTEGHESPVNCRIVFSTVGPSD